MPASLEAVTTRYIDFYQVQDKYGQNYTQSYTIQRIDENGILTDEIISKEDLEKLCAANSELASRMKDQGIQTDILGNACFTTDKLSRFLKYGLDQDGNLYVYNYTGDRQLVSDKGLPETLDDPSTYTLLIKQYNDNQVKLYQEQITQLQAQIDSLNEALVSFQQQIAKVRSEQLDMINSYEKEITSLQNNIDTYNVEINKLEEEINDLEATIAELKSQMSSGSGSSAGGATWAGQDQLTNYTLQLATKKIILSTYKEKLNAANNEMQKLRDEMSAKIIDYEVKIASLDQQEMEIKYSIDEKTNEIVTKQNFIDLYNASSTSDLKLTESFIAQIQSDLPQLSQSLEQLQNEKQSLEALIGDSDSSLDKLYERKELLNEQLVAVRQKISENNKSIESLLYKLDDTSLTDEERIRIKINILELEDDKEIYLKLEQEYETSLQSVRDEIENLESLQSQLDDVINQIPLIHQLIDLANQLINLYNAPSFYSAIDANYSIKWGNIEASGLSIMRLIMLITIARAESLEESLVTQIDSLATSSVLLQNSASAMETILNNTVNYNTTFNGQKLGDFLKKDLKIAESISLPTTNWTQDEKDAVIKAIEDRQDALNVVSQETSINIQSLINKRDQSYLLGSNSVKLLYSGNLSVARNI